MSTEDAPQGLEAAEAFQHLGFECLFHDRWAEAVDYLRQALAAREHALGSDHPEVANSLIILAGVIGHEEFASLEIETLNQRAADIYEAVLQRLDNERGEVYRYAFYGLLGARHNLALQAWQRGDLDAAEAGFRDINERSAEYLGPDYKSVHPSLPEFARVLTEQGKWTEAERLLTIAVEGSRESGRGDPWTHAVRAGPRRFVHWSGAHG